MSTPTPPQQARTLAPVDLDAARRLARRVYRNYDDEDIVNVADTVGSLADEVERLREALKVYGRHESDCRIGEPCFVRLGDDEWQPTEYPCSCGLDALLGESP